MAGHRAWPTDGQLNSVQVHRLVSEEGVDQRITQILREKAQTFDAFARDSDIAQHAPEAYDISEADLAREVITAERQRLLAAPAPAGAAVSERGKRTV